MKRLYIKKGSEQEILLKVCNHEINQGKLIKVVKEDPECSSIKIIDAQIFTFECRDEIITYTLKP